jgi:hypothetical protein
MSNSSDAGTGSSCESCPSNPQNIEESNRTNGEAPMVSTKQYRKNYGTIDWSKKLPEN